MKTLKVGDVVVINPQNAIDKNLHYEIGIVRRSYLPNIWGNEIKKVETKYGTKLFAFPSSLTKIGTL